MAEAVRTSEAILAAEAESVWVARRAPPTARRARPPSSCPCSVRTGGERPCPESAPHANTLWRPLLNVGRSRFGDYRLPGRLRTRCMFASRTSYELLSLNDYGAHSIPQDRPGGYPAFLGAHRSLSVRKVDLLRQYPNWAEAALVTERRRERSSRCVRELERPRLSTLAPLSDFRAISAV